MERQRRSNLLWRRPIVLGAVIALFWTIWYMVTGEVPVTNSIRITENMVIALPFGISRWWDVLFGPVCSFLLILSFTSKWFLSPDFDFDNKDILIGPVNLSFFMPFLGLNLGLLGGLLWGLIWGLQYGLAIGLISGLIVWLSFFLASTLLCGLAIGLICGLFYGLKYIFSRIFSQEFGQTIVRWLSGK